MNCRAAIYAMIIGFFLLPAGAVAAPALNGSSGLLSSPSADVLAEGDFSLGAWQGRGWQRQSAAFGLGGGLEIAYGRKTEKELLFEQNSLKISLRNEGLLTPGIAIGGERGGAYYGTLSKFLPGGYRFHLGIGSGRFGGVFGGVEKVLNPPHLKDKDAVGQPVIKAVLDFDGDLMHYALRAAWKNGVQGQLAYSHGDFYGGVSFSW